MVKYISLFPIKDLFMTNKGSVTRVFLTTLAAVLSIVILAPIGLIILINPNDYKQDIQDYIQANSDYSIDIKGKITLSWYPWLGLDVQDLTLRPKISDPQQTPLLSAQQINLKIPVQRLLKKEFQLEAISINNANIHVTIDSKGKLNWPSPNHKTKPSSSVPPSHSNSDQIKISSTTNSGFVPILPVDMLKIQNSTIHYIDKASGLETLLENVDIDIDNLAPNTVTPIKTSFDFAIKDIKANKTLHTGHSQFSTRVKNQKNEWLLEQTHSELKWQDIKQNQSHQITADAHIRIQPSKEIKISNLVAMIDKTPATGTVTIPLNKKPILFDITMDSLNLNPWLAMLASNNEAPAKFTKTSVSTKKQSHIPDVKGKVTIQQLQYQNLKAQNVNLNINILNNKLKINPLTASLYKGKLKAQIAKNITDNSPTYIKGQLNHVDMQALLNDAADTRQLQGIGDIVFEFTQSPQSTRGTSHITIQKGVVQGFDLDYYYDVADSFLNKKPQPSQNANGQTQFNQLTATVNLNNHMLNNPDLLILGDGYKITGNGGINLQQSLIKYDVMAVRLNDSDRIKKSLPLAVQIKGPLNHPTITPDLNKYAQMLLEQEGQRLISHELNKLIGHAENDETSETDKDNDVAKKIEKEISRGLKKLFKF